MAHKLNQAVSPLAPPNLSKENINVWNGWHGKGDREIAREAAAKGVLIDLAKMYLSKKRNLDAEGAEKFIKSEVFVWVDELLSRQQIFRASHILKNIALDPPKELQNIFYKTTDANLREYIGNHLIKLNELEERLKQLWHLLDMILKNNILISKYKLLENSLQCLDRQTKDWQAEIAAKLFLRSHDLNLLPFLDAETLWKQLLIYNDIKLLNCWIDLKYNNKSSPIGISENILKLFQDFPITFDMVNHLNNTEITSANTRNVVLNEFSKYGIFTESDSKNVINILQRLKHSDNLLNIYNVLSKSTANLSLEKFFDLLTDYLLENQFFTILSTCLNNSKLNLKHKSIHIKLLNNFRELIESDFKESVICDNILIVSNFLRENVSLQEYFYEYPLLLLFLLILYNKNISDGSILINNEELDLNLIVYKKFPLLESIFQSNIHCNLTYYDLLQKHIKIDINLFKISPMFYFDNYVSNEVYNKKVNYLFYVKQFRPSIAAKAFHLNQLIKYGEIQDVEKKLASKKVYKYAMNNFTSVEIVASCVAFLEMIGCNSDFLRVSIAAANVIYNNCNNDFDYVKTIFQNVENDPAIAVNILETIVMSNIDELNCGSNFVKAIKSYDIVIRFCQVHNITLPDKFLRFCAKNNLWLPLLIVAQIKNYPIEQMKIIIQSFKNTNLLEHISHCVQHDIQVGEQNILLKERDSRKYFLSRIGVRKSVDSLTNSSTVDSVYSSITSQSSYGSSNSASSGSDFLEIDIMNTKATLLQTLIRCHNSTDPPRALLQACQLYRNPLLAILATSYEPDSVITNWITWLAVSSNSYQTFTNFDAIAICAKSVMNLLDNAVRHNFTKALEQSFYIFIPDNPLTHFIEFLNLCLSIFDVNLLKQKLDHFKNSTKKTRRASVYTETDHEMTYLHNKLWIECTAIQLLATTVQYNCKSLYEKILFMKTVCKINLENYFSVIKCPNFENVFQILNILYESNCDVDLDLTQAFNEKLQRKCIVDCLNHLVDFEQFESALKIAQIENLPLDFILIKEWQCKFENRTDSDDPCKFWQNCNNTLIKYNITADCVIDLYLNCYKQIKNALEQYTVLKLAQEWSARFDLSNKYELEKKMWISYINLDECNRHTINVYDEEGNEMYLYKEMLEKLKDYPIHENDSFETEWKNKLDKVVCNALNRNNFWLALKLERIFGCKNGDLEILKLCQSLAEGLLMPYQLNTDQRLLLSKGRNFRRLSNRRTFLSARLSSFSSGSHSPANSSFAAQIDNIDAPLQDTLAVLQSLSENLTHGSDLAYKIFMTYRISINIEIPYHVIISNSDNLKMLKDALADDCNNKLEVVHDFINVYKWSKDEIADFLCEEIVNSATYYIRSKNDIFNMWDLNIDQEFHLVLQLLQDNCSILGYKIYSYASAIHKGQLTANADFKISELALVSILLIAAHDCFTADCNMEGISIILKKCQTVISHLLTLRSWKLIVRLLTGVARYTEMSYVFQILKEHDQFEFLLRKGSRKDNGLKVALLDYLKKYCPDNKELYKLVALHFALFSEVAQLWEREAQNVIKNLIQISKLEMQNNKLNPDVEPFVLFSNTDGTRICLNKAVENYTHATEFHLQGEKLAKAMNSAKQAELLALQLSLFKSIPLNGSTFCILNLNTYQISNLISSHLNFEQSHILISSYNYTVDWASVLFEQCIIKNNTSYLDSYLQHFSLTDSVVYDISRKFLSANINTPKEITCMKSVLVKLPSVHAKYRIASELGFVDLVEDLLASGQLAYLKDTVWKKGYKS